MKEIRKVKKNQNQVNSELVLNSIDSPSLNEHIAHSYNNPIDFLGKNDACVICSQTISNPICAHCYLKHLRHWLEDHPIQQQIKKEILNKIFSKIRFDTLNDTECIICGKEAVSFCTYCFFLMAENIIIKSNINENLMSEFEDTFNYQLYHNKYY